MIPPLRSSRAISRLLLTLALLVPSLYARPAEAVRVEVTEDVHLDIHFLLQTWMQATSQAPGQTSAVEPTFRVRRSRLVLTGRLAPRVGFFLGTGYDSDDGRFETWDAVAFFDVDRALTLDAGLVMLPFLRHAQQFSVNLHTVEFMRTAFLYPRGSTAYRRAPGVWARGLLFDDRIDYRLAVTTGAPTDSNLPRITGRAALNLFDPEPGYILPGTYFGRQRVVAVGAAFDLQPDVVAGGGTYRALGADLFWSIPSGENRFTGQAAFVHYRGLNAVDAEGLPIIADRTGVGTILDLGYAFGAVEPVVAVEWFRPRGARTLDAQRLGASAGLNWWIYGPTLNLKVEAGLLKAPGLSFADATRVLTVQLQTRLP
jgi:hypothetical protein